MIEENADNMSADNDRMVTDDEQVQQAYEQLLDSYAHSNHRRKFDVLNKAFKFADQAHRGVKRRSGEPYILHPLAVAQIVIDEMGLGSTSIAAALLHDVVEDTDYTVEDIRNLFGDKIAQLVDGLTKISGGIFAEAASAQAENMRRLLLTMSNDIRVILIKIADRLHNMRTLGAMLPAKQYKIAGETTYLYAPMAHRLGLFAIKTELEDLSFKYEHPEAYKQIEQKLMATADDRDRIYARFAHPLELKLNELGVQYKMHSRTKSVYSIWHKMQAKNIGFEDVYDIFAARIIFEPRSDTDVKKQCWDIYSAVTDLYKPRPDRIRDWLSHPKENGYQALHITVMGPDGFWIEIQIRSDKMDNIAEKGYAAHWKYKEENPDEPAETNELDHWLARIQDILEAPSPNAMDFLDTIKLNLYGSEIFVFTPHGDMRTMPQNATALDFAYEIHTDVGDHCIGAKVNHTLVPLSHRLESGDQVEILTSRSHYPKEEWTSFVTTAKAKTRIELFLRKQQRNKMKEGEKMLTIALNKAGIEVTPQVSDKFCAYYVFPKKENLYYALAEKQIELPENLQKILKEKTKNSIMRYVKNPFHTNKTDKIDKKGAPKAPPIDKDQTYLLKEEDFQKNFLTQSCCQPIPGDDVFGFIRDDGLLEIHKHSCLPALTFKTRFGDRIVSCEWAGYQKFSFQSTLQLTGLDRIGMLNDITRTLTYEFSTNVRKFHIESTGGLFEGRIEVDVHSADDLNKIINRLQKIKGVKSVVRVTN
ncbi:RelA/SpoT family protein [Candidatus Symbiothrix dinenymphae]|uniref:RelA/SpoT family protein n=1 Tax=Candidatus Symbiothrix dinenymphae TaxID=467085 RepID=UPI000B1240C5|nr:RelA/SpoT family protein [Candidatus Symbiothrix dinenymphae]